MKKRLSLFFLWYIRSFARLRLRKINPKIIGVGGASGKTSLSNFIYTILSKKFETRQSRGKNSETGIPLDILGIKISNYSYLEWLKVLVFAPFKALFSSSKYQFYIAEMGIDSPKEPKNMSYLLKILTPDVGVLTNISFEHSRYFEEVLDEENSEKKEESILKLTAEEESLLLTSIPSSGTAILNIDDENIQRLEKEVSANRVTISHRDKKADYYIENIKNYVDKFFVQFVHDSKQYMLEINNPLPEHFAYSFVLAIAVCRACGVSEEDSIQALKRDFSLPPGRMSVFEGIKDTVIIDSSYNNATLTPILDLLSFVKDIGKQRRRIGIIGDMRELGVMEKSLHEKVAEKILETLDFVILVGPLTQQYILPMLKKNDFPSFSFLNFTSAKSTILEQIKPKDMVLIKGSQNTLFLERAVELLLKNKEDVKNLCRRGEYWDRIREKTL